MYSWTSDQYSQYDSLVIAANVRDATDTLDGILGNQTALEIEEHTTDTHGYTEMIFGAYDLLDLRFAPRIRDLDCQRLYQHGTLPAGETSELLRHRLRPELITPHGDSLFRLAASLKHGWAPASLLLSRLQASGPRNPIARALQEYGRLVKTNFILEWLGDEQLRRRYGRQLNKGENLNGLRRVLFYAYEGQPRHRNPDQQQQQALCLTLIVNAIVVWNTVYAQLAIDQLRAEGQLITTGELEGISPLQHAHLHAYGEYPIDLGSRPVGYRPLRQPLQREPISQPRSVNRV
jgi:TnpA family transposase